MRKLMTLTLAVLLLGVFAAVVYAAVDSGDDGGAVLGTTETTGTTDTVETTEAETTETTTAPEPAPRGDVDVSGPCDEAEHANDPRCTGAAVEDDHRGRDDDRGFDDHGRDDNRGFDDHGGDDDRFDDHGGDDDNSGPGGGDDDFDDDDSSGHGGGGNSGPGGGGED